MKRSLSVEDLFETSDLDDETVDLDPPDSKETTGANGHGSSFASEVDSDRRKSSFNDRSKGSTKLLQRNGSCEISDSEEILKTERCSTSNGEQRSNVLECNSSGPVTEKSVCQYGKRCYRKNPSHFKEFDHPDGSVFFDNLSSSSSSSSKRQRLSSKMQPKMADCGRANTHDLISESLEESQPFSFFLTKVHGIGSRHNTKLAIGIKDILSRNLGDLQKSAQFNYCIDIPWLISRYPEEFRNKPLLIVHGAKGEEKLSLQEEASKYDNVRLCQAPLDIAYGTHHTKMMLLLYNNGLRVVIHTANLVDSDWYQKTQGVWISPLFPKLANGGGGPETGDSSTNFKRDLIKYLSAYRQRSLEEWIEVIRQSDLSAAKVVLVGSVPGRHIGANKSLFGHLKLQKALQESGPEASLVSDWSVIGQFSSVGSLGASSDVWLTSEWLSSLSSVRGFSLGNAKLQLIYPSKENVRCSLEGYPAGSALPYSIHTARKQPYFTSYLHQWKSNWRGRTRASPHIKTYTRTSTDGTRIAWFLVTSANMSKAAWGSLEKNGTQLFIRSYELGVLFLPQHFGVKMFTTGNSTSNESEQMAKCDSFVFPVPFDLPLVPYEKDDRPWIWDIPYVDKPDSNGNMWSPS